MKRSPKFPLSISAAALLVASCAASFDPKTGDVTPYAPSSSLAAEGSQEFLAMKRQKRDSSNGSYNSQVSRVSSRLKKVVPTRGTAWEFVVFDDPTPNAFALPGGKIGIHTGMFKVVRSDGELAAVLGHEMAHVTLNHAQSKKQGAVAVAIGKTVVDQVLASQGLPVNTDTMTSAAGTYGVLLPYSRHAELQADKLGTIYMAKAGYDPEQAVTLWKRFDGWKRSQGLGGEPEFMRTHPVDATRISALQEYMPTAKQFYRK